MSDCPVKVGEKHVSLRSGEAGEVVDTMRFGAEPDLRRWEARLRMTGGSVRWVTCSKAGIKGYRLLAPAI